MSFSLAPQAERALEILHQAGYEAWIVGGCVRDLLLGRRPADYDLTTSALPQEVQRIFAGYRTLDTGLKHGTVTVLLDGLPLEITTYRVDVGCSDARHPDRVQFTRSLREDAARRDFTINAMAYAPGQGVQDFFGGQEDLKRGILRCVGDPERRFQEDALRILRALRFSAVLGFSLEEGTAAAARSQAERMTALSAERVCAELGRLVRGKDAGRVLEGYPEILGVVLPELLPMIGLDQCSRYHCYDLLTHTARAMENTPPSLSIRLAALFHDCGKPACFTLDAAGEGHFYGHPSRSADLAAQALARLRFPRQVQEETVTLIRYHGAQIPPQKLKRWLNRLGPRTFFHLLSLQRGDTLALAPAYRDRVREVDRLAAQARAVLKEKPCLTVRELVLNGHDMMALGYRGREIGAALEQLLEAVLEGRIENEETALRQYLTRFHSL